MPLPPSRITTCPSRVIYEDTRQKRGRHSLKHAWWAAHGVEIVRRKLDTGDYWADGSNFLVDTKQSVQELAANIGRDHDRFVRELDRATADGKVLVILVEEHPEYQDNRKLATWVSRMCLRCRRCDPLSDDCVRGSKPINGPRVAKTIDTLRERHGARFMFCDGGDSAEIICGLLGVSYET